MSDIQIAWISADTEGEAAEAWLAELSGVRARRCHSLDAVPLAEVERLWVHAVTVEPSLELVAWLRGGGRLLATLEAVELPWRLGLEPQPPDDRRRGSWRDAADEFRPDTATPIPAFRHARGFAAFGPHPLFGGAGNGAVTWLPVEGEPFEWLTYRATRPERGAGVAVERVGHTLHPPRWIAWEHQVGDGGILCLGAFARLAPADPRGGAELRALLANALLGDAIPHGTRDAPATHWPGLLADDDDSAIAATGQGSPAHLDEIWDEWPPTTSPILIESGAREENRWLLTGRRTLLIGSERNGLREIWVHPYRLVRDARILVNGSEPVVSVVRTAPDEVIRVLRAGEVELTERFTVALDHGLVFWSVVADASATISLRWESDLRRTGPYPPRTSSVQVQTWGDAEMRVTLSHEEAAAQVMAAAGVLTAHGATFEVRGEGLARVILAAASSESELERVLAALGRRKLRAFRQERILHARRLEERLTTLEAPEPALARAFAWAKVRFDQSLGESPGVGRSVLADDIPERPERARYVSIESCRIALAAMLAGDREIIRDVLRFLVRARDRSGQIPHEITSSGLACHDGPDGNGPLARLAEAYLAWTGDRTWLERQWPGASAIGVTSEPTPFAWNSADPEAEFAALRRLTATPAAAADLVRGVIEGLWGVAPDATRETVTVAPYLPAGWNEMSLRRLRIGATTLDLRLRRRPGWVALQVVRSHGPRLRLAASLRNAPQVAGMTLNDEPLGGSRAVFDLGGEDEVGWPTS